MKSRFSRKPLQGTWGGRRAPGHAGDGMGWDGGHPAMGPYSGGFARHIAQQCPRLRAACGGFIDGGTLCSGGSGLQLTWPRGVSLLSRLQPSSPVSLARVPSSALIVPIRCSVTYSSAGPGVLCSQCRGGCALLGSPPAPALVSTCSKYLPAPSFITSVPPGLSSHGNSRGAGVAMGLQGVHATVLACTRCLGLQRRGAARHGSRRMARAQTAGVWHPPG